MFKKILILALCFSWVPAMAADKTPPITIDFNMIQGQRGLLQMRSVTQNDKESFGVLLDDLKNDSRNPSGVNVGAVDLHVNRREKENNSYHMMVFSLPEIPVKSAVIQGRMPVFGFAAGKSYDPDAHKAIIEKWKSLGVRQTVGAGEDAHDERVENFGLLNFVPLIHSTTIDETRKEIYTSMIDLAKALRAQKKTMTLENNHRLECTDAALPNHVVMLLDPKFRDIELLKLMGWSVDENPEFEKFYDTPRIMMTYDLTS